MAMRENGRSDEGKCAANAGFDADLKNRLLSLVSKNIVKARLEKMN
jgi:hypothetical protein